MSGSPDAASPDGQSDDDLAAAWGAEVEGADGGSADRRLGSNHRRAQRRAELGIDQAAAHGQEGDAGAS